MNIFPIQPDIIINRAVAFGCDGESFAAGEGDFGLGEEGCADGVLPASRADGVEAEGGEDVPGRCLAIVFVTAVAVGCGAVEAVHGLADAQLAFPGLRGPVIQIQHVLGGLVAVGVVSHIGHLHLGDFVDAVTVVAVVIDGRDLEDRVKHFGKGLLSAHCLHQSGNVVENAPGVVPGIALGEGIAPFVGAEGLLKRAIGIASSHKTGRRVKDIAPIPGALQI